MTGGQHSCCIQVYSAPLVQAHHIIVMRLPLYWFPVQPLAFGRFLTILIYIPRTLPTSLHILNMVPSGDMNTQSFRRTVEDPRFQSTTDKINHHSSSNHSCSALISCWLSKVIVVSVSAAVQLFIITPE